MQLRETERTDIPLKDEMKFTDLMVHLHWRTPRLRSLRWISFHPIPYRDLEPLTSTITFSVLVTFSFSVNEPVVYTLATHCSDFMSCENIGKLPYWTRSQLMHWFVNSPVNTAADSPYKVNQLFYHPIIRLGKQPSRLGKARDHTIAVSNSFLGKLGKARLCLVNPRLTVPNEDFLKARLSKIVQTPTTGS